MSEHIGELESPPAAEGIRLIPLGDPYLQKPNRPLLASDPGCASGCSVRWGARERC
jgi:hypothetical protein